MSKPLLLGLLLILSGGGIYLFFEAQEQQREAQDAAQLNEQLRNARNPAADTPATPKKYFPSSEASLFTGSDLRAFAADGTLPSEYAEHFPQVLEHACLEHARRKEADAAARWDVEVDEADVRAFVREVVAKHGEHPKFENFGLFVILQGHVTDGQVDW